MRRVELLAPAGDLEKLKIAILYGADAVYIGGSKFSLRARANNFTIEDIREGCKFAKEHHAKVYVTMNVIPHDEDFDDVDDYLKDIEECGVTGIIVSSMEIIDRAKIVAPKLEIHISTQMSIANSKVVEFYEELGAKRVVLARELSMANIKQLISRSNLEVEVFIHGGMCISMSGRCTMSNHFTGRDANRGGCAHSCRWNYDLFDNTEKIGTEKYVNFGSKDLCAVSYVNQMIEAGVASLKIEGRMKSLYYIATVVRCYREIIDAYYNQQSIDIDEAKVELAKAENRLTSFGFLAGEMTLAGQLYDCRSEMPTKEFVGIVKEYDENTQIAIVEQRNYFEVGDVLEIFGPNLKNTQFKLLSMTDENDNELDVARHPLQILKMQIPIIVHPFDMLRKSK